MLFQPFNTFQFLFVSRGLSLQSPPHEVKSCSVWLRSCDWLWLCKAFHFPLNEVLCCVGNVFWVIVLLHDEFTCLFLCKLAEKNVSGHLCELPEAVGKTQAMNHHLHALRVNLHNLDHEQNFSLSTPFSSFKEGFIWISSFKKSLLYLL